MIISVSIVDKHKPPGDMHVGTYFFEIDYPHESHFDFMTGYTQDEVEARKLRPVLNRLLSKYEIPDPVNGDGSPI